MTRYVFQVSSGNDETKRVYVMQAENGRHVDEWISTIGNVANNECNVRPDIGKLQVKLYLWLVQLIGF